MRGLRQTVDLAQGLGEELGGCEVLQRKMPPQ